VPYDQLLKDLLRTFFAEFLQRFFPESAAHLELGRITFLEQEAAIDLGQGRRRTLDLVAEVGTREGPPELVLVHVELQARPEPDFPERMFEYYALLRRRHRIPVLPIAVYVTGGRGTRRWERYREEVFGDVIVNFHFRRLRLRAFKAIEVVGEGDPLTCALAALMDRRGADLATMKARGLQGIAQWGLDEARQWLLVNFLETYLPLKVEEDQRYRRLLAEEEYDLARQVEMTWGDRLREQGRQEGQVLGLLRAKRDDLLTVLRARFEPVPEELVSRIESIETVARLDSLLVRAVQATTLDDVRSALPD
jgi:hypothetical protein